VDHFYSQAEIADDPFCVGEMMQKANDVGDVVVTAATEETWSKLIIAREKRRVWMANHRARTMLPEQNFNMKALEK
jgi:hypothetical protein